jgi:hypothetical protein
LGSGRLRDMRKAQSAWRRLIFVAGFGLVLACLAVACSGQPVKPSLAPATGTLDPGASTASVGASPVSGAVGSGAPTPTETTPAQPVAVVPVLAGGGPTAAPPAPPSAGQGATVTLTDDGMTIRLRVGDRFLLDLGDPYIWDVTIADPSIVSRVVNIAVVRGAQGVYEARAAGETRLQAIGDLPCRQSRPPCLAPSRLFRLVIVVS